MSLSVSKVKSLDHPGLKHSVLSGQWVNFFPGMVFSYDPETDRVSCLNEKLKDLGYSLDEFQHLTNGFADLVHSDDLEKVEGLLTASALLAEGESTTFTARFVHRDGSTRWLKNHCTKSNQFVMVVSENITDQIKFEEEARAARLLFDETEKLLQFGSWSWSPNSDKLDWTEGMFALLDCHEVNTGTVTVAVFLSHVLPDHSEHVESTLREAAENKKPFEIEFLIRGMGGRVRFVSMKGKPLLDNDGNVKKMVGTTRDITAKKNFETERDRSIRELNRSNKELEEFAYVASHDLHEPLRKILTFSERLKTKFGPELGNDGKIYLERIWASAASMRNLIDNLLEFSRISRSKRIFLPCDLNIILQDVISDQELRIEETATRVKVGVLPVVEGVPVEMKQLFNNLIGNALKFRKTDVQPMVEISSKQLSHKEKSDLFLPFNQMFYEIQVKDNGIGFESMYAEKIFEIFQRLHGKAEYAGSGIGLSICKKIVENHDGIIYASSEPGIGSSFSVILPEKQH